MTTGTASNYGSVFQFPSGTPYPAQVLAFPELVMGTVDMTNHSSGGFTEFLPSGLLNVGPFDISLVGQHGTLNTFKTAETAKTVACCVVKNPIDTMVGNAMITKVVAGEADATDPDIVKVTVTVQFTGGFTVSDTA